MPFKYEINYDKNLKSGEYVIDVDGKEGTKVTSWTIKNSEIVDGPNSKVTEEPVNAIIRVGQKDFTGELKTKKINTIMFETEYVVDETLEPGTTVVEQEGELGIEETEVTHKIVNGEATETVDGETVQTKAPVKRIIKIGTKCETCEPQKPCEPEKPEQPEEPTEPSEPEQPTEPEIPGVTDPVEPTAPSDKTPEQPEEPSKPSEEKPEEPSEPSEVKPSQDESKVTAKAEKNLKPFGETGAGAFGLISGLGLITAAVATGVIKKRKEDE